MIQRRPARNIALKPVYRGYPEFGIIKRKQFSMNRAPASVPDCRTSNAGLRSYIPRKPGLGFGILRGRDRAAGEYVLVRNLKERKAGPFVESSPDAGIADSVMPKAVGQVVAVAALEGSVDEQLEERAIHWPAAWRLITGLHGSTAGPSKFPVLSPEFVASASQGLHGPDASCHAPQWPLDGCTAPAGPIRAHLGISTAWSAVSDRKVPDQPRVSDFPLA